ncbi:MAG: amidohydrolase family protein [Firmicutes bacterium]|nr:amidohydrolase family protein [Bacillota bacterium]
MPPVIDVHHHYVPQSLVDRLRQDAPAGDRRLVSETISITLSEVLSDLERHWADMDQAGIDQAVFHQCALNVFGTEVCRLMNDAGHAMSRRWPDRFIAAAHLAPQDGPDAVQELERAVEQLGFRVVALPTSTLGLPLDDPAMEPIWARLDAWRVPVILHPALRPKGAETRYSLERSIAREADIAAAVVRLIYAILPRWPHLRVVVPHSGGAFPYLKGRVAMFYEPSQGTTPAWLRQMAKTAQEQTQYQTTGELEKALECLYFDCCGHGAWAPPLRFLGQVVGWDHVVFGTDYPLEAKNAANLNEYRKLVSDLGLGPAEEAAVLGVTFKDLLGQAGRS